MEAAQRLQIHDACMRLSLRYAFALDHRDYDAFALVFSPDAIYDGSRPGHPCVGRNAIRAFLDTRDPHIFKRHVISNVLIDVLDMDHAQGRAYWTEYVHPDHFADEPAEFTGPNAVGEYRDDYIRIGQEWFISRRLIHRAFRRPDRTRRENSPLNPMPTTRMPTP